MCTEQQSDSEILEAFQLRLKELLKEYDAKICVRYSDDTCGGAYTVDGISFEVSKQVARNTFEHVGDIDFDLDSLSGDDL